MTTTTTTTTEITADQVANGTTAGVPWTVARYGKLVIAEVGGTTDDLQYGDTATAIEEFDAWVDSLTEG